MPWIITTTLTVFIPLTLLYWYVGRKLHRAFTLLTPWGATRSKRAIIASIIYLNAFPLLFFLVYLISGRGRIPAFSGENLLIDVLLIYPFWFGLVIAVQVFLVLVWTDVAKFLLYPVYKKHKERWLRVTGRIAIGALSIITVYSAIVIVKDTWTVRVVERTIQVPPDAEGLDGVTFVHISDVQGDGRTTPGKMRRYIEKVNALGPDVVFFAGDLVTSGEAYIESSAGILGEINARVGRIAAVGDHDIFSNKTLVLDQMRRNGFLIADDTTFSVTINDVPVTVTLLTHTYRQRPGTDDLERAVNGSNGKLRILLVHQPAEALVEFATEKKYDLFLAGHTHGGGIAFGIPGVFLFAPASIESRYVSGFYDKDGMLVSVTNGLGMTLTPIRFHAPAEISVIRLVKG